MNNSDFTAHAIRVAEALGKELGGRFDVLAHFSQEEREESPTRTIRILDRWSDQDSTIEIRKGAKR